MRSRWKCPDVSLRMASSRVFLNSGGHTEAHLVARWTELPTADSQQWALAREEPGVLGSRRQVAHVALQGHTLGDPGGL